MPKVHTKTNVKFQECDKKTILNELVNSAFDNENDKIEIFRHFYLTLGAELPNDKYRMFNACINCHDANLFHYLMNLYPYDKAEQPKYLEIFSYLLKRCKEDEVTKKLAIDFIKNISLKGIDFEERLEKSDKTILNIALMLNQWDIFQYFLSQMKSKITSSTLGIQNHTVDFELNIKALVDFATQIKAHDYNGIEELESKIQDFIKSYSINTLNKDGENILSIAGEAIIDYVSKHDSLYSTQLELFFYLLQKNGAHSPAKVMASQNTNNQEINVPSMKKNIRSICGLQPRRSSSNGVMPDLLTYFNRSHVILQPFSGHQKERRPVACTTDFQNLPVKSILSWNDGVFCYKKLLYIQKCFA